jgi:ankyrin repeat protein
MMIKRILLPIVAALGHMIYLQAMEQREPQNLLQAIESKNLQNVIAVLQAVSSVDNYASALNAPLNDRGWISLYVAVQQGSREIAEFLLRHGALVTSQNTHTTMPLLVLAAARSDEGMAELLIRNQAPINGQDQDCWTPLHWAVQRGNVQLIKLLIDHGASINSEDKNGRTPLYLALQKNQAIIDALKGCTSQ